MCTAQSYLSKLSFLFHFKNNHSKNCKFKISIAIIDILLRKDKGRLIYFICKDFILIDLNMFTLTGHVLIISSKRYIFQL